MSGDDSQWETATWTWVATLLPNSFGFTSEPQHLETKVGQEFDGGVDFIATMATLMQMLVNPFS